MTTSRITDLVAQWGLAAAATPALESVLRTLASDPQAPTTVTDPALAVDVHLADSLDGLALEVVRAARVAADLGAGAGFPGLALAIAEPTAAFTLVEATGRKCEYLRRCVEAAGLTNVDVVHARAEDWPAGAERHDLVTARALGSLSLLVEYAAPLLASGGHLVAWKAQRDADEERDGRAAAEQTGLREVEVLRAPVRAGADQRRLYVYEKVAATPPRFPRRPGIARKRPLRATAGA